MLSSMSVFVLEDLCFNLRSLPPKEAIVPVVSKDILEGVLWYRKRVEGANILHEAGWRYFNSCSIK